MPLRAPAAKKIAQQFLPAMATQTMIELAASLIILTVKEDEEAAALEISQLRNPKALLRMS